MSADQVRVVFPVRVAVRCAVSHLCPFRDERDVGVIDVSWDGDAVELHALADYLKGFEDQRISHEQLTDDVRDYVESAGGEVVRAVTRWTTAGLAVSVEAT